MTREEIIRQVAEETGEPEDIVAELYDAMQCCGEEATFDD